MEERGQQTVAPRSGLPSKAPSRFDVVFWIAFGVSTMLVVGQVAFILSFTPVVLQLAHTSGAAVPAALAFAGDLGPLGIFLLFALGDAAIFALFAWFGRRYWVGLLFVPPILYLAGSFGALWVFALVVAHKG
jgi:hypothetical protein